jgi:tetratricopeptide (TPR) repeat protein
MPDDANTWYNRGNALQELKQYDLAIESYNKTIKINPDDAEAWTKRGNILHDLKKYEQALYSYDKAISIKPSSFEVWSNRGNVLQDLKQYELALASYSKAISINPDFADAWFNHGNACKELKQFKQALASFDNAIKIKADYADAFVNRGNLLQDLKLFEQALASLDSAISIKVDCVEAWSSRGNVLQDLKQFELALVSHNEAIRIDPNDAQSYYNRSLLKLMLRDFKNGYEDYKYRWKSKELLGRQQKTSIPSPLKNNLQGRLFVWAEQGLGDEVFYAGLLPMLSSKEVCITLSADRRLHPIFKRSFYEINIIDKNELKKTSVDSGFDAQTPIGDLGHWLGIDEVSVAKTRSPYLISDADKSSRLRRNLLGLGSKFICGLAWKSSNEKIGPAKSISLAFFEPLLRLSGIQFVNLQYGDVNGDIEQIKSKLSIDIHQVPGIDLFNDVDGLLSLIDACDIVVTTSNVTAHLAGAIGKRAAVLLPFSNGRIWYWHTNDRNSFWYPSLRVFSQDNPNSWEQPIADCSVWVNSLM